MIGFYFSSVPKLKIRCGGVVGENEDILLPPSVSHTTSIPEVAVPQVLEAMVSIFHIVSLALGITAGVPSISLPTGPLFTSKDFRSSDKRKAVVDSDGGGRFLEG
ncbi:hypothetical protein Fot_34901 [Forsythia ovata]|uniref:Uncharacterized protein n=1 Tax=Forsythia ovata TaxID=205694 RepID=A0ABD1SMT3_9LAMI